MTPQSRPRETGVCESASSTLGNSTKSAAIPSEARSQARWNRFNLQEAIAEILPEHRCTMCGKKAVPTKLPVLYEGKDGGHWYGNVRACGSVWVCPYCAAKVGARRAQEIRAAIDAARSIGLSASPEQRDKNGRCIAKAKPAKGPQTLSLLTFTVSHHAQQSLADLDGSLARAQRRLKSGRPWQDFAKRVGFNGSIRNGEVTWGERTGWHPHVHALWFTDRPLSARERAELHQLWVAAADKEGLYVGLHGLEVTTANREVYGYLTKVAAASWAAPEELTMGHYKRGRGTRFAPFDLVRGFIETGDIVLAERFREYAQALNGRRQLYWSKGLRQRVGLGVEASDEETANAHDDEAEAFYAFSQVEWRAVTRGQWHLLLLEAADSGGFESFKTLLDDIMGYGAQEWFDPVAAGWDSGDSLEGGP